jgi:hypothetical protein
VPLHRRVLVAAALGTAVLSAPGGASTLAAHPTASRAQQLATIESETRAIRGLSQLSPVKAVFETNAQFNRLYGALDRKGVSKKDIAITQRELVELGWIRKDQSYSKIEFGTSATTYAGLYDRDNKALYVRAAGAFGIRRDIIAHEYTHALQDQHYHLSKLMPNNDKQKMRNSDIIGAVHALTEGDAVTTQLEFVLKHYSPAEYQRWYKIQVAPTKGPALPTALNRDDYFPYNEGFKFVWKLFHMGGMSRIDRIYANLPNSTYVIMDPNAYLSGWRPVPVTIHHVLGMSGWKQVDDDVFGAWDYKLLLWETLPEKTAGTIARTYKGDRYVFLENGARNAYLLRSVWSSHVAAVAAAAALESAFKHRFASTNVVHASASSETVTTPGEVLAVSVAGSNVSMAYGPTVAIAEQLRNATTS